MPAPVFGAVGRAMRSVMLGWPRRFAHIAASATSALPRKHIDSDLPVTQQRSGHSCVMVIDFAEPTALTQ
jgi:hypothetical protein